MPYEEICKKCKGLGKCEESIKKPTYDFIDDDALERVKNNKTVEEYDKFLLRLESEKKQRQRRKDIKMGKITFKQLEQNRKLRTPNKFP